jgi:hypothetical protein
LMITLYPCTYGMQNSIKIDFFEDTYAPEQILTLKDFLTKEQYKIYDREDLEKIVKKMIIDNNEDINQRWEHLCFVRDYSSWPPSVKEKKYNTTALGLCIKKSAGDYPAHILADVLVDNGARLSEASNNKFGYYFVKKIVNWDMTAYDVITPATKLFEILLYRRVQYCIQKSSYIYLIARRLKNKALLPNCSLAIPKFVLDHITHYIIKDGVTDVINVCSEEYDAPLNFMWTVFTFWEMNSYIKEVPFWEPKDLRPFDPRVWRDDFNEFMQKKRNKNWDTKDSNLIMRALHYKTESLYKDEEFKLRAY